MTQAELAQQIGSILGQAIAEEMALLTPAQRAVMADDASWAEWVMHWLGGYRGEDKVPHYVIRNLVNKVKNMSEYAEYAENEQTLVAPTPDGVMPAAGENTVNGWLQKISNNLAWINYYKADKFAYGPIYNLPTHNHGTPGGDKKVVNTMPGFIPFDSNIKSVTVFATYSQGNPSSVANYVVLYLGSTVIASAGYGFGRASQTITDPLILNRLKNNETLYVEGYASSYYKIQSEGLYNTDAMKNISLTFDADTSDLVFTNYAGTVTRIPITSLPDMFLRCGDIGNQPFGTLNMQNAQNDTITLSGSGNAPFVKFTNDDAEDVQFITVPQTFKVNGNDVNNGGATGVQLPFGNFTWEITLYVSANYNSARGNVILIDMSQDGVTWDNAATVTINQPGYPASVSPTSLTVNGAVHDEVINVSYGGMTWGVTETLDWITTNINSIDSLLYVHIAANAGAARTGVIVFTYENGIQLAAVTVSQGAALRTLTYNNGGGGNVPEPAQYAQGELLNAAVAPYYPSHEFTGWKRSDNNAILAAGESFYMPSANLTLTAQWTSYNYLSMDSTILDMETGVSSTEVPVHIQNVAGDFVWALSVVHTGGDGSITCSLGYESGVTSMEGNGVYDTVVSAFSNGVTSSEAYFDLVLRDINVSGSPIVGQISFMVTVD